MNRKWCAALVVLVVSAGIGESLLAQDCNENEVPDRVDISLGESFDCNGNNVPDECDLVDTLISRLTANDGVPNDRFGKSVSIDGDIAIVGAYRHRNIADGRGAVYVFREIEGEWQQSVELSPNDAPDGEQFGYSISLHGNTAVIGAFLDDYGGTNAGAAYVFREVGGVWQQITKLTADDARAEDWFGYSVSLYDDTAIIGANQGDDGDTHRSGSAYVFREIDGQWQQLTELTADNAREGDHFGASVSINGDTAVIGANRNDDAGFISGSAYVFREVGGVWQQITKLTADDAKAGDRFGYSVSLYDDTAIIGAHRDDDGGTINGSAYLFREINGTWQQISKLTAIDGAGGDEFGYSVSISGDRAIVGSWQDDDAGFNSGSAYVFHEIGGVWRWVSKLTIGPSTIHDYFGTSVSISGSKVIVGAWETDVSGGNNNDEGLAYIFETLAAYDCNDNGNPDDCDIASSISEDCNRNEIPDECDTGLGTSLDCNRNSMPDECDVMSGISSDCNSNGTPDECDVDCNTNGTPDDCDIAAGTSTDCNGSGTPDECDVTSGSSTDCDNNGVPDECETDCNENGVQDPCDIALGTSIDCDGSGVPDECETDCNGNGVLDECDIASGERVDCNGNSVPDECDVADTTIDKLIADDAAMDDEFGVRVSFSSDTVIIGSWGDDDAGSESGSAYLFRSVDGTWQQIAKLVADDAAAGDAFGFSVALDGETAVIGAFRDDDDGADSGAVYVFREANGTWTQTSKLTADDISAGDAFGYSVAIDGDTVVVGARRDDDGGSGSGSAYVFREIENEWRQVSKLTAADANAGHLFGHSVEISKNTAVIGAMFGDSDASASGSAYVFKELEGSWQQVGKLTADNAQTDDRFGASISLADNTLLIGAYRSNEIAENSGSVYVFSRTGGEWLQIAQLTADDAEAGDHFGGNVTLSGDSAVIGATRDDDSGANSGAAYLFREIDGTWRQGTKLSANDATGSQYFGKSVSLLGELVAIGASGDDGGSGAVYLLQLPNSNDCNDNTVPDECDLVDNDCNSNDVPDECEPGCNENSFPDSCDIASGASLDCDANGIPDECDPDCNNNGTPDECDLISGTSPDCNSNSLPDECDLAAGTSLDVNNNGIPDECAPDCSDADMPNSCNIIYVSENTPIGQGDGTSWETAYGDLNDALAAVALVSSPVEVRISQGTFVPGANPEDTFLISPGVTLKGGYAGDPTQPELRDLELFPTTLSGETNGLKNFGDVDFVVRAGNCEEASVCSTNCDSTIDGITIEDARMNGLAVECADLSLIDCNIIGCGGYVFSHLNGGGISATDSTLSLTRCRIIDNTSSRGFVSQDQSSGEPGAPGAGIYTSGCDLFITGSEIRNNRTGGGGSGKGAFGPATAGGDGGGLYLEDTTARILNTIISGNVCGRGSAATAPSSGGGSGTRGGHGGGVYIGQGSEVEIINSIVARNTTGNGAGGNGPGNGGNGGDGGGIYVADTAVSVVVTNSTLTQNELGAAGGGSCQGSCGIAGRPGMGTVFGPATIHNSIISGNQGESVVDAIEVSFNCIEDFKGGTNNVADDALLIEIDDGQFRLSANSPCVDAGNNEFVPHDITVDFAGNDRFRDVIFVEDSGLGMGPIVDMGALEVNCSPQVSPLDDCDLNDVADRCDIDLNDADCNENGVFDLCDLFLGGGSDDCDGNIIPDECDPDCNKNGEPDACDISNGISSDCNGNGVSDECEPDCDNDGIPDECALLVEPDCNTNTIPDVCDVVNLPFTDLDGNGVLDQCDATRLYVNPSAQGLETGLTWADAYMNLADALVVADSLDGLLMEMWISEGVFKPHQSDREQSFQFADGLNIIGSFAGSEGDPSERDIDAHPTILSGEIGNIDSALDNSCHVVAISDQSVVLDGLTIEHGNGRSCANRSGAGILVTSSDLTIRNVTVRENAAGGGTLQGRDGANGGGIAIYSSMVDAGGCSFSFNQAGSGRGGGNTSFGGNGGHGGGIFASEDSMLSIKNCVFDTNAAGTGGSADDAPGGVGGDGGAITASDVVIQDSLFVRNSAGKCGINLCCDTGRAGGHGGAISATTIEVTECIFEDNNAGDCGVLVDVGEGGSGGAINGSSVVVMASLFYGNRSGEFRFNDDGCGGAVHSVGGEPLVSENSIFWSNTDGDGAPDQVCGDFEFAFSIVEGLQDLSWGNLNTDPLFTDPDSSSFTLQADSPAIDSADLFSVPVFGATDFGGSPRLQCGRLDIGPYEFGDNPMFGDAEPNGVLNLFDIEAFQSCETGPGVPLSNGCRPFDFDCDNDIDSADFRGMQLLFPSESP